MTAAADWFAIQRLRQDIYLIAEPMHVNSYLIVGSRRAVLFDTDLGIAPIRPFPTTFEPMKWAIEPPEPTQTLDEGDTLDLGGRALTVLHTPGHA